MAGTSHTTRRWPANATAEDCGSRSIRNRRDGSPPPDSAMPVPRVARPRAPSTSAETAHGAGEGAATSPAKVMSWSRARRRPRPGDNNEIASSTLVLPAPLGPVRATRPPAGAMSAVR